MEGIVVERPPPDAIAEAAENDEQPQQQQQQHPPQDALQPAASISIPDKLGQLDPRRMLLTPEETVWALQVKRAIAQQPEIDTISDFMCAQLAILAEGDTAGAVERAAGLQAVREEYKFMDNYQDGRIGLRQLVERNPRQFLSFSYSELEGKYVLVHDVAQCDVSSARQMADGYYASSRRDQERILLVGGYFLHHAMTMDFASIRQGLIVLIECEGYNWSMKGDWKILQRFFTEILQFYPLRAQLRHFHNGLVFNILASMLKPLLPQHLRDTFQVGCQFDGRLDQVFLVPTVKEASQRILERLGESLRRRYNHEHTFKLPDE